MLVEKHEQIIQEVLDEIDSALKDSKGLVAHQRRLAFTLSLGAENLLELYFHKQNIMKGGAKLDHRWFKRKKESIFNQLSNQITTPITSVKDLDKFVLLICKIEDNRDELAYGSPTTDIILQKKINLFFELKKVLKC
ncbi:hypothetical protein CL622_00975 [archaeon]|nr:hypothetical protein [archaeon]|tara:strand:- start:2946 stop:3356 length:411 start_codon:yes stop_codon:yes gene_type:complete